MSISDPRDRFFYPTLTLVMDSYKLTSHICEVEGGEVILKFATLNNCAADSALDKLLGQLGTYATWLSSIAYLQKQLRIFIFFTPCFLSVITPFLIA